MSAAASASSSGSAAISPIRKSSPIADRDAEASRSIASASPSAISGARRAASTPEDTIDVEIFEPWLEPFFDYGGDFSAESAKVERDLGR